MRNSPPRVADAYLPRKIQSNGDGTAEILAYKYLDNPVTQAVSGWYQKNVGRQLNIKQGAGPASSQFSIMMEPPNDVNILDTGAGLTQVLPVLTLAAQAELGHLGNSPVLAIEQPELHLHPKAERALAEHFCQLATRSNPPRFLLETHSENFLLQVQLEIVRGNLSPDRVRIYRMREREDGQGLAEIVTFDELAQPSGWPPGFFSQDSELARQIVEERRKKRK